MRFFWLGLCLLFSNNSYSLDSSKQIIVGVKIVDPSSPTNKINNYIISEISKCKNRSVKIQYYDDMDILVAALKNKDIDVISNFKSSLGNNELIFSSPIYSDSIYSFSNNRISSLLDFDNKTIIVPDNKSIIQFIKKFIISNKINSSIMINEHNGMIKLRDNEIIISNTDSYDFLSKSMHSYKLGYLDDIVLAYNKTNVKLRNEIDQSLDQVENKKKLFDFIQSIKSNYNLNKLTGMISQDSRKLLMSQKFTVLVDNDYAPFTYWSEFENKNNGEIIDLINDINQYSNHNLIPINYDINERNWNEITHKYNSSMSDLIIVSGNQLVTNELYYSKPIRSLEIAITKHKNFSYNDNLRIGVISLDLGSLFIKELMNNQNRNNYKVSYYKNARELKSAYISKEVDAIVHNSKFIKMHINDEYRVISQDYLYFASQNENLINAIDEYLIFIDNISQYSNKKIRSTTLENSKLNDYYAKENERLKIISIIFFSFIIILSILCYVVFYFYKKSRKLVLTNQLTKLKNRRYLDFIENKITNFHGACIFIDIDRFKSINDIYGHNIGDRVLVDLSKLLKKHIKSDYIFHLSCDQFFIFIGNLSKIEINKVINNILLITTNNLKNDKYIPKYTFSTGVYYKQTLDSAWLEKSDIAMYVSKKKANQEISYFNINLSNTFKLKKFIEHNLAFAIQKNEIDIFFQPKVCAKKNKVIGFEGLARWKTETAGHISPNEFIPIAENQGLISNIDILIAEKSILAIRNLLVNKSITTDFVGSFNFSMSSISSRLIVNRLKDMIVKSKVPPKMIQVEITETQLYSDRNKIIENFISLRDFGITIALDDFSTGNSSILHLSSLPFNCVKLDKELLQLKGNNGFKNVISLINQFNIDIIAEGVEDKATLDFLMSHNISQIQGFYFYKPMTFSVLKRSLEHFNRTKTLNISK